MRYNAMVVKLPNGKLERFSFNLVYGGVDHDSVITGKQLSRLLKIEHSKLKGVKINKTRYNGLRVTFHGDKEIGNFYLENKDGSLLSFEDYINLNLMMSTDIGRHGHIIVENDDYINNTEISFVMFNGKTVFNVRK